jgi:hypothetical protein
LSSAETPRAGIDFKSPTESHGTDYAATPADIPVSPMNFHKIQYPINMIGGLTISDRIFKHKLGYTIGASSIREYRGGNTLQPSTAGKAPGVQDQRIANRPLKDPA